MLDKYKLQVGGTSGGTTYTHVLEVLLRLRQVCNHWSLCKNRVDKLMALLGESDKKVVELTPENVKALQDADDAEAADASAPSSKVKALIKILTAKGQAEQTKTVVFSQWTSFLDIIEPHLTANNVRFTRIDGKLNSNKRDQAIAEFSNDPKCTVLLASLNVCSVGLNLKRKSR